MRCANRWRCEPLALRLPSPRQAGGLSGGCRFLCVCVCARRGVRRFLRNKDALGAVRGWDGETEGLPESSRDGGAGAGRGEAERDSCGAACPGFVAIRAGLGGCLGLVAGLWVRPAEDCRNLRPSWKKGSSKVKEVN